MRGVRLLGDCLIASLMTAIAPNGLQVVQVLWQPLGLGPHLPNSPDKTRIHFAAPGTEHIVLDLR